MGGGYFGGIYLGQYSPGDAPAIEPSAALEVGRLGVEVYDSSGDLQAYLTGILGLRVRNAVNQVGERVFTLWAGHPGAAELTIGREVRFFREGEGEIPVSRGIIKDVQWIAEDGPRLTVVCSSLMGELTWPNTYLGIPADDITPAAAMTALLADATGWTALDSVTSPVNVTDPFVNQTPFRALQLLAETQDGYIRETATPREIELKNTTGASGLRLVNVEQAGPGLHDNDDSGLIASMSMRQEGMAIINRIVPFGADAGDVMLSLNPSSRSSPYTIQQTIPNKPRLTNSLTDTVPLTSEHYTVDGIITSGVERYLLIAVLSVFASGTGPDVIDNTYNGIKMELIGTREDATHKIDIFGLSQPPAGRGTFQVTFSTTTATLCRIIALSFEHVDIDFPTSQEDTGQSGSSTTPSTPNFATFNEDIDIAIAFMASLTNVNPTTVTEGDGQDTLANVGTTSGWITHVRQKRDMTDPDNLEWTVSSTGTWMAHGILLHGAALHYIEDSTSVTAYGRRAIQLFLKSSRYVAAHNDAREAAANTLYDIAATRLQKLKDPITFYDVEVVKLSPSGWLAGDSIRLDFRGVVERDGVPAVYHEVDADLIVLERVEDFDAAGVRRWALQLAAVYRFPRTPEEIIRGQLANIADLEAL